MGCSFKWHSVAVDSRPITGGSSGLSSNLDSRRSPTAAPPPELRFASSLVATAFVEQASQLGRARWSTRRHPTDQKTSLDGVDRGVGTHHSAHDLLVIIQIYKIL